MRAVLWLCAAALPVALVFVIWPGIDLTVAALAYTPGEGFVLARDPVANEIQVWLGRAVAAAAVSALALLAWAILRGDGARARLALYLALSLALGPGLIVNAILKDNWGRARPSQVTEFGGARNFTPAFVIAGQCQRNCSFVSGDASIGFATLALALLVARRRTVAVAAAVGLGAALGAMRIGQGGHFFSDVVFAGVFTALPILLLHRFLIADPPGFAPAARPPWSAAARAWALAALGVGALAALLIAFVDRPLALWIKREIPPGLERAFSEISRLGDASIYIAAAALGVAACWWMARRDARGAGAAWRARLGFAGFALAALCVNGAVVNLLKFAIGRQRPRDLFASGAYGFEPFDLSFAMHSFPSGHSQAIWTVATALALAAPRWRVPLFAAATVISLGRAVSTKHYAADVLVGAFLGIAMTTFIWNHWARRGWPLPGTASAPGVVRANS
jgi:lipid A 4'-phosphatase